MFNYLISVALSAKSIVPDAWNSFYCSLLPSRESINTFYHSLMPLYSSQQFSTSLSCPLLSLDAFMTNVLVFQNSNKPMYLLIQMCSMYKTHNYIHILRKQSLLHKCMYQLAKIVDQSRTCRLICNIPISK